MPTETAISARNTLEPTPILVPPTPTLTPEELLKAYPEIVAMSEYGMSQEQAQKLEGLNVNFEVITQYVYNEPQKQDHRLR